MLQWVTSKERQREEAAHAAVEGEGEGESPTQEDQIMHTNVAPETIDPGNFSTKRNLQSDHPRKIAAAPKRRRTTETELLLRARGLSARELGAAMDDSGICIPEDVEEGDADVSVAGGGGYMLDESLPIPIPAPNPVAAASMGPSSTERPVAHTKKRPKAKHPHTRRVSLRARTSVPSPPDSIHAVSNPPKSLNATARPTSSKDANCSLKKGGKNDNYKILPHVPGTTEVIFDRYPALRRLVVAKRGKKRMSGGAGKHFRKMPDMDKLVFLCKKASTIAQDNIMRVGAENGVVGGSGGLIFLRRNMVRAGTRVGV